MNLIKDCERIEDLQCKNGKIIQNPNLYTFANDPILLVNFSKIKRNAVVVDLCSGSAIIPILVALKSDVKKIFGIEIQTQMSEMSKRSVELNNLQDKIEIINDRVQNFAQYLKMSSADVVFCNPPYFKKGQKKICDNDVKSIARHELEVTLEEIVEIASLLLNSKGQFYLVHQACRLQEIMALCSKNRLAIKELMIVQANENVEPHLVLVKAVKDGKEELKMLPPLILNNEDGSFTEEVNRLYAKSKI